jgi:NAD(P)-dependent dehydrogenase (short-subunit alcohol dehydrogenase family)
VSVLVMAVLEGRRALVTGGSRGIGRAVAAALARAGATVTVLARDLGALEAVVSAGEAHAVAVADVTDAEGWSRVLRAGEAPFDILVANAGAAVSAPFGKSDDALFRHSLDVNLMGVVHAMRAVLPGMVEGGFGRIVAVASTAGLKGYPYVSAYCAAKHAVVGLVRAVAAEVATTGVTVNAVCPGFTDTDLVAQSLERIAAKTGRSPEAALAELVRRNPQKRLVAPAEVADAVLWLCGAGAASVTGQAIAVAGGEV